MSIVEEVEGRRIAKGVEARAKALEVLNRSKSRMSGWYFVPIIALGVGLGAFGGGHDVLEIGIIAGVGYSFGLTLFFEVMWLRRRLQERGQVHFLAASLVSPHIARSL